MNTQINKIVQTSVWVCGKSKDETGKERKMEKSETKSDVNDGFVVHREYILLDTSWYKI